MGIYNHESSVVTFLPSVSPLHRYTKHGTTEYIANVLLKRRMVLDAALRQLTHDASILTDIAVLLVDTLRSGHKVLVAGNGGSAAEAQHFAAELVGRFKRERAPYAVLSLTTDTSILTAVANDYGYQDVFTRQILAFGQPGDVFIAFSTSGESENLLRAVTASRQCVMSVVAITGERSSRLASQADIALRVPVADTEVVQELHMLVTHMLCDVVETQLSMNEENLASVPQNEVPQ